MTRATSADAEIAAILRRNPEIAVRHVAPRPPIALAAAELDALGMTGDLGAPAEMALSGTGAPLEHDEQCALFAWADAMQGEHPELAMLVAIPNGGYRPMATAARLKAEGVKAGYPDCFLAVPRPGVNGKGYHGLFLELKRVDRSNHATALQREWIERLRQWGYQAVVCYGAQEAIEVIKTYLGIE